MLISAIATVGRNWELGKSGHPIGLEVEKWRDQVSDHVVIVGRKTWEAKVLPLTTDRTIVLTRERGNYYPEELMVKYSVQDALKHCARHKMNKVYIVGGASVFVNSLPFVDVVHLLHNDEADLGADVYFPQNLRSQFSLSLACFGPRGEPLSEMWERISEEVVN